MIEVRAPSVRFYSPMDEGAFFEWIKRLEPINEVYGEARDIVLSFKYDAIPDADFHELIAIFRRYNIDKKPLRVLVNERNEDWVKSWESDIFS